MMRNDSFYQSRDKQTSRKLRSAVDPQHFTKFNLDAIWDHFTEELDKTKKLAEEACQSDGSRLRALLHMQVTQLTSILDFYMHELGRYVMVQIFMGCWPRNKQYQSKRYDFFVPEIEGIILSGRQEEDTFRDFIGLKENAQSYIQPGKIQKLFEVLDISYQSVCDQTGYGAHTCTCILQDFGDVRNIVVHQTGRSAHTAKPINITQQTIDNYTRFLEKFVGAIHETAKRIESNFKSS